MNVALWTVQVLLAFAFIASGAMKLFAYEKYKIQSEKNGPTGITRRLATLGVSRPATPETICEYTSSGWLASMWVSPCVLHLDYNIT